MLLLAFQITDSKHSCIAPKPKMTGHTAPCASRRGAARLVRTSASMLTLCCVWGPCGPVVAGHPHLARSSFSPRRTTCLFPSPWCLGLHSDADAYRRREDISREILLEVLNMRRYSRSPTSFPRF
jgi:hypothetical protein